MPEKILGRFYSIFGAFVLFTYSVKYFSMKHILTAVFFSMVLFTLSKGQTNRASLRNPETKPMTTPNIQPSYLHGRILDGNKNAVPGASVVIVGTKKAVNANESGEYLIDYLQAGKLTVQISMMGFKAQNADLMVQSGENSADFILVEENIHLEPITVVALKREQQVLDVPAAISVVGSDFIEKLNVTELGQFSEYVPGLLITEQGANRPSFVIRGLTSDEVSPSAQPRVSVFYNNVPVNRASGASVELFDMERVEVLKGPQNTLFGRGAQIGAIHFISKSPENRTAGYLTAGLGSYNQKELRGAVNMPVVNDKLFVRVAGVYDARDGYVTNTFGGTLNGKNTTAGRFSARFLPARNQKLDLVVNYQKDNTPGIAFMSKMFPNTLGETDIFSRHASLEQGTNLGTGKEILDATLTYRYLINEHTYWSSISSYRKASSSSRWDGDGTAAPAIDMADSARANQFYQELRYNFSVKSRLNGSVGISYWHENADQAYWFSPNEQSMANLFLNPAYLIMPNGQPLLMPALPNDPRLGQLAGMPLPANHQENNFSNATNQAAEGFAEATYQLTDKLFFNGGLRAAYENFELGNEAAFIGGSPSTLGMMTGNYPNLFFKPSTGKSMNDHSYSVNWQGGLQYKINEYANIFANYSNGRRPKVLQYDSNGTPEVLNAERVNNVDAGMKMAISGKFFVDLVAFYQKYNDFQSRAWVANPTTGEFNYKSKDGGKATSYGTEITLKATLLRGLDLFGNYAFLHATFDDTDSDRARQEYAGNTFRLSPEHSFALGFYGHTNLTKNTRLFLNPSYAYKTHFYFEDANTAGLEQAAYGLLNANCGLEFADPAIILSLYGTNLLDEKFITSAGNTGSLFGVPTFVPGPLRMLGVKVNWRF